MNSKDLRAVQHVAQLTQMGMHSLKIEGRTKSHYYVARTCQTYKQAIDDACAHRPFDMDLMDQLEKLSNRGYTEGFFRRHPPGVYQNYEKGTSQIGQHQFVGEAVDVDLSQGTLAIRSKNHFAMGDQLELMTPSGNACFKLEHLENSKGQRIARVPGSDHIATIPLPDALMNHTHNSSKNDNSALNNFKFGLLVRETIEK